MNQKDHEIHDENDGDQISNIDSSINTLSLHDFKTSSNQKISDHQSNQRKQNIKLLEMQLAQLATDEMIDKFECSTQKLLNIFSIKINNELNLFQKHVNKQLSDDKLQNEQLKNEIINHINNIFNKQNHLNTNGNDQLNDSEPIRNCLKVLDDKLSTLIDQNDILLKFLQNNQSFQSNSFHNFVRDSEGSLKVIDNFNNYDRRFVQQWIETTGARLLAVCKEHEARTNYWQKLYLKTVDNKNENIELINKTKEIITQCKCMMNRIKEDMKIVAEFDEYKNELKLNKNLNESRNKINFGVDNQTNRLFSVEEEAFN